MITKIGWGFGRCNQRCAHCYNASTAMGPAYPFSVLHAIADRIAPHITDINYGTGEFIMNPNALTVARYIHDRYPHVTQAVTTNGSSVIALNDADLAALFHDVDVSLDFPDPARHIAFRRHPRAWTWAMDALDRLRTLGIPRTIVTCVTARTTDDDVDRLLAIAAHAGALWRVNWFRCVGRGDASLRITATRAWAIIRRIAERAAFVTTDSIFGAVINAPCQPCTAGRTTCRIHEDLRTSPYPFLKGAEWDGGNIGNPSVTLATIADSVPFRRLRARAPDRCRECPLMTRCRGGCATRAILHPNADDVDDYCPIVAGLDLDVLRNIPVRTATIRGLVHDGYLCTTIVDPTR